MQSGSQIDSGSEGRAKSIASRPIIKSNLMGFVLGYGLWRPPIPLFRFGRVWCVLYMVSRLEQSIGFRPSVSSKSDELWTGLWTFALWPTHPTYILVFVADKSSSWGGFGVSNCGYGEGRVKTILTDICFTISRRPIRRMLTSLYMHIGEK